SPFFMHFDHAEIEEGPMGYMVQDRFIRRALLDAMASNDAITHLSGDTVIGQAVLPGAVSVSLASGSDLTAKLLVGADGRSGGTATRAGIKRIGWGYEQAALVCAIEHEKPHNGVAHQFFMPTGPLAILPLPGNVSSIVWSETAENAALFHALPDTDYMTMLKPRFGDFLGDIKLTGQRYTYPLSLSLAQNLVKDRIALIGDAAHGVHPIAGQGLNAGMRDIAALAQVITDATRRGEDPGSTAVLHRYEEWRRFDNTALAIATDGFNRLFSNDNAMVRSVRDMGMGIVNAIPGMRRGFMREAAGLTGDLPRLMQGRPL
ncbi:MAG: FAD-dependent monooxygenase, partial [Tateyamaria sp.]